MFSNPIKRGRTGSNRNRCYYTVDPNTTLDSQGNVVWGSSGSGGSSFDPNTFDWGGTIGQGLNGLGGFLSGVSSLLHPTQTGTNPNTGQPYPNNTQNQPVNNQPQGLSTTTVALGVVLLILIIAVIVILLKTKKSAS